jgi:multimeric flavodoxin WrbA
MNIIVLNGSPKGKTSVTLQYIHFLQKKFPEHSFEILHISKTIRKIEDDEDCFGEILTKIADSEAVLWASPVYYFVIPSNYKRFIELINERDAKRYFHNKYTGFLSTSTHFFDHTAHNYIHSVCEDLGMNYVGSYSADTYDLLKAEERKNFIQFATSFFKIIENRQITPKVFRRIDFNNMEYSPSPLTQKFELGNKKLLIVTDAEPMQSNLIKMINRLQASFKGKTELVNLHNLIIKGSCLGCNQCAYDNTCVYEGKDEFIDFYNNRIKNADILIFAGTIKDRYLSSLWKKFFDRSFFTGHSPTLLDKQVAFIVSGPLRQIPNLRQILESYAQNHRSNLVDIVTDEYENSEVIDNLLAKLAEDIVTFDKENFRRPSTFLGVGGMKVFRDDVWGRFRFPFKADHLNYKKHGLYDFPQRAFKVRVKNAIMLLLCKIPSFRKDVYVNRMKDEMIKPFQKYL